MRLESRNICCLGHNLTGTGRGSRNNLHLVIRLRIVTVVVDSHIELVVGNRADITVSVKRLGCEVVIGSLRNLEALDIVPHYCLRNSKYIETYIILTGLLGCEIVHNLIAAAQTKSLESRKISQNIRLPLGCCGVATGETEMVCKNIVARRGSTETELINHLVSLALLKRQRRRYEIIIVAIAADIHMDSVAQ